jgi:hypothetical protein
MKKMLFVLLVLLALMACSKESRIEARCGWVTHKYYQNPPSDTTVANRTYWLLWAEDTVCQGIPCLFTAYNVQVTKAVYDTMIVNRYPDQYCY